MGYEFEGITGYVYSVEQPETVAIHSWYNARSGDNFYTADPSGELAPGGGYRSEGIGWYMYPTQKTGTVPLYRWYNARDADHFYTTDQMGEFAPSGGYTREGITGYLYPYQAIETSPLHRWFQSGMFSNFIFDHRVVTEAQKNRLLERHAFAYYRSGICRNLQPQERDKVREDKIWIQNPILEDEDVDNDDYPLTISYIENVLEEDKDQGVPLTGMIVEGQGQQLDIETEDVVDGEVVLGHEAMGDEEGGEDTGGAEGEDEGQEARQGAFQEQSQNQQPQNHQA
ncbi:hypothetical protein BGZ82_001293 [Podila clonocystis]|nr:hypothetical protein BGZ82_001293 [Podila clonocystis]